MTWHVKHTRLARADLKEIGRYIAEESRSRAIANAFLDAIARKCSIYAKNSELGEACPDLGVNVRRFPVGNYVVFYRRVAAGIEVLRVFHGSGDFAEVWRRKE